MAKPKTPKADPKPPRPHAGVDRRRKDMRGRKYTGTLPLGTKY